METTRSLDSGFAVCVRNDDYPVSLEPRKIYRVLRDAEADALGFRRVIDESGEDYLYPSEYFVPIEIPRSVEQVFQQAS